jgi:predicted N-acetyltransferase YhbS
MFRVENMTADDVAFAIRLTNTMNWNFDKQDFEFMLKLEPKGCFTMLDGSKRAGIVTTVSFGKIGWLGNLIVSETLRGKGAGTLLAKHAVKYLRSKNVETIGLYAYTDKIHFYNKLGFERESEFVVLTGRGFPSQVKENLKEAQQVDVQSVIKFDRTCFGASRAKLLDPIIRNQNNLSCVSFEDGRIVGYAVAKKYEDMAELGPLVCKQGRTDVAIDLLKTNLSRLQRLEVFLCAPKKESKILNLLMSSGFTEDFRVARMFFKPRKVKDCIYMAESLERG